MKTTMRQNYHVKSIFSCTALVLTMACIANVVAAQTDKNLFARDVFINYQEQHLQEKIFVHIDKTVYLAGEIAWFKVYAVDAFFNKPSAVSGICYVEIIDNNQKPIVQATIGLHNGSGSGSVQLPASVSSGNFLLRAYTSWMKNLSPDFYYHQPITIVNTLRKLSLSDVSRPDTALNIQFFPEGGNLVYGLTSRLAFKVTGGNGKGVDCSGVISDEQNNNVASFQSLHFGMGNCLFTPVAGHIYHATVTANGRTINQPLPDIYQHGFVISVNDNNPGRLGVTVTRDDKASHAQVYLFVQTRGMFKDMITGSFNNGVAVFDLEKAKLGEGISQLTVFDQDRRPVCERLYFKKPENLLQILAVGNKAVYNTRQKVMVDLSANTTLAASDNIDMSVAVFRVDSLQPLEYASILHYLLLSSDIKGIIESPGYYFDNSSTEASQAADNLMLTQGWRRFRWDDMLAGKVTAISFFPETNGPVIEGMLQDKTSGMPVKNVTAYLSVPGTLFTVAAATSNERGELRFNPDNFYGSRELIVQVNEPPGSDYVLNTRKAYSDSFSGIVIPGFALLDKWKEELTARNIDVQADNSYQTELKRKFFPQLVHDTTQFYGVPDQKYFLDDYTRFLTMEEVMHEYVNDVRVRKAGGKFEVRVSNNTLKTFFDDAPLSLIDGVPETDADKFMALDPLKIKKIEVVSRKFFQGPIVHDGIVSLQTYEGNLAGYDPDSNALVVAYDGLQQQREFYSPVYQTDEQVASRIPDVRNVLFWSADIHTMNHQKKQLWFYTSDAAGKYAIIVQGLSNTGLAGSTVQTFEVKK